MEQTEELNPRSKIWIVDRDGKMLFGDGRYRMLEIIERTGSMNKAAREMGMSFRTLWGKIRDTEKRLGVSLVENRSANRRGGSRLTEDGKRLMDRFARLRRESGLAIDDLFRRIFGNQ